MQINLMLNGVRVSDDVAHDTLLIDFVRRQTRLRNFQLRLVHGLSG